MRHIISIYGAAILIVFYLAISFFYMDFNPTNWEQGARFLFAFIMIIVAITWVLITAQKEFDS